MTKTALIAGQGALPGILTDAMAGRGEAFVVAALDGFSPDLPGLDVEVFRLERLVPFMDRLLDAGVTDICLAGAVRRPKIEPELFDPRTAMLVPRLAVAMQPGDDATLRIFMEIFEEHGLAIRAAHDIAPDLLPPQGLLTRAAPGGGHAADAELGEVTVAQMGRKDIGQACVVANGQIVATEGPEGTDAMLRALPPSPVRSGRSGILFKAPKPDQDRRADLPVIGPGSASLAVASGLEGIVIEAGGVMIIDLPATRAILDDAGLFLWVRPLSAAR